MSGNAKGISAEQIKHYSEAFYQNPAHKVAANAAVKNGVMEASVAYQGLRNIPYSFSVDLEQGSITAQKSSGRCWIFAALNTLRYEAIHRWGLKDLELSQSYVFFYDKLEKANYFLENVLSTLDEPVNGRLYSYINAFPLEDGGQWSMFANIINKYGIVPKDAYPETANTENSRFMNQYLTSKLREFAAELRKEAAGGASADCLREKKKQMLESVYRILVIALGEPPAAIDFTMYTKDGTLLQSFGITPREFYKKYIDINMDDFVSLINAPTSDKPFDRTYTVKFLGNVADGDPVLYLNLPMDTIKSAMLSQLKDGHPVWFGSDCGKFMLRKEGIFDRNTVRVEDLFDIKYNFTKGERLEYGDSAMNHAMVFLGANIGKDGKPDRWRVENSWGGEVGHGGYYTASDSWVDEFVYQAVVYKKYLGDDIVKMLDQKPIELEPWDPMGTLAR